MRKWLRRIRGAVGMGLTWGVVGFLVGLGIEMIHNVWPNPLGSRVDIWPAALAYPGFFGGVIFSTVLGLQGAVGDSMSCRFPDSRRGARWVVSS